MDQQLVELVEQIDAILPQTQCKKCGFPACRPYAEAIAEGRADINQCPPGDWEGILKLANLLGVEPKPLNTYHGISKPQAVASIDENLCIGCTLCIQACPVDAIAGAAKQMHTVISAECTGCELCISPCPMDCISMVPVKNKTDAVSRKQAADHARARYQFKLQRLKREKPGTQVAISHQNAASTEITHISAEERKKAIVQAAIKRATTIRNQASDNFKY